MAAGSGVGVDRGIDVGCVGQRNLANDGRCGGLVFFKLERLRSRARRHYLAADVIVDNSCHSRYLAEVADVIVT